MENNEILFNEKQYAIPSSQKNEILLDLLYDLTLYHSIRCIPYNNILKTIYKGFQNKPQNLKDLPYIPVSLFKEFDLKSIPENAVLKTLTSSGTTSQQVSKIAIDKETSMIQTKALSSIVTSFIGPKRLPMIIIDTDATSQYKTGMNARGAGLVGLSNFGRNHFYALDSDMNLNIDGLMSFIEKYSSEPVLIFGFTFMVWQNFYQQLVKNNIKISIPYGILIHSGGWKKLTELSVSNEDFKSALENQCGIRKVHNFYGMVEQVGSVYMECENGFFHSPNYSDIIIRNYRDWSVLPTGAEGLIQTLSVLPKSYPGHSILTEDLGVVYGIDDCKCGRKGTYFKVSGRVKKAELRGCSDIYASAI